MIFFPQLRSRKSPGDESTQGCAKGKKSHQELRGCHRRTLSWLFYKAFMVTGAVDTRSDALINSFLSEPKSLHSLTNEWSICDFHQSPVELRDHNKRGDLSSECPPLEPSLRTDSIKPLKNLLPFVSNGFHDFARLLLPSPFESARLLRARRPFRSPEP